MKDNSLKYLKGYKEKVINDTDIELSNTIYDLIQSFIYLRDVPYSMEDGAKEIDPDSVKDASSEIIKMLKSKGLIN